MATTSFAQASRWDPSPAYLAEGRAALATRSYQIAARDGLLPQGDIAVRVTPLTALQSSLATYQQGVRNSLAAGSLLEVAYQGASKIRTQLEIQEALVTQAEDASLTDRQRAMLQTQLDASHAEITRIAQQVTFGGQTLLDGSLATSEAATVALGTSSAEGVGSFTLADLRASALYSTALDVSSVASATVAANAVADALESVDTTLTQIAATQTQFTDHATFLQHSMSGFYRARHGLEGLDLSSSSPAQTLALLRQETGTHLLSQAQRLGPDLLYLL